MHACETDLQYVALSSLVVPTFTMYAFLDRSHLTAFSGPVFSSPESFTFSSSRKYGQRCSYVITHDLFQTV